MQLLSILRAPSFHATSLHTRNKKSVISLILIDFYLFLRHTDPVFIASPYPLLQIMFCSKDARWWQSVRTVHPYGIHTHVAMTLMD